MAQKRIRALDTYIQLDSGDVGYISPDSLFMVFDSDNFGSEPKKYSAGNFFSAIVDEGDILTGISNRAVSVTFGSTFTAVPITVKFDVYRYTDIGGGKYVKQKVLNYLSGSNWLTTSGFAITIDDSESLTGVIIEYYFIQS